MSERQTAPRPSDPRGNDPRPNDPRPNDAQANDPRAAARGPAHQQPAQPPAHQQPAQPPAHQQGVAGAAGSLLSGPDLEAATRRWHEIQGAFVDAPQQAVQEADALVADLLNRVTQMFEAERRQLESHWNRQGDQVSTEDLRVALQRYRSFFQRLLSMR